MENLNNHSGENDQNINGTQSPESFDEFDPTKGKYNVAIDTAKTMVDPELCPESMWRPLQSELVDLSLKMIEWHENNDGSDEVSQEAVAAYRKLDNDRADIAVRILPREATFDDMNKFYSKLNEAAQLKREIDSN